MTQTCDTCYQRMQSPRQCVACGEDLKPNARPDQRYCSARCKVRIAKRRARAKLKAEQIFAEADE